MVLVNRRQVRNVRGRKTDPADAAPLLPETRELWGLCRMRTTLARGETDPVVLAELARGRLTVEAAGVGAGVGRPGDAAHRLLWSEWLRRLHFLEEQIARLEAEIESHRPPFEAAPRCG